MLPSWKGPMQLHPLHRFAVLALVGGLTLVPAATASADVVVADDQLITGKQCIGSSCADGEAFAGNLWLKRKASDTPGLRLEQSGGSFPAQTWEIGGNEANFFIRDLTGGSRLPFRIRPGAATSSIDIFATSEVN